MRWPQRHVVLSEEERETAEAITGSIDAELYVEMCSRLPKADLPPWDEGGRSRIIRLYKKVRREA